MSEERCEPPMGVIPYLHCRKADEAIAFYEKAFGAKTFCALKSPDGKIIHGAIAIEGSTIYLAEEFPEFGGTSPLSLNGTSVTLHIQVKDCEAVFNRAVEAGCTVVMPLEDMFWGDRYGIVVDPYGHKWSIATTVRAVTSEEMNVALQNFK